MLCLQYALVLHLNKINVLLFNLFSGKHVLKIGENWLAAEVFFCISQQLRN